MLKTHRINCIKFKLCLFYIICLNSWSLPIMRVFTCKHQRCATIRISKKLYFVRTKSRALTLWRAVYFIRVAQNTHSVSWQAAMFKATFEKSAYSPFRSHTIESLRFEKPRDFLRSIQPYIFMIAFNKIRLLVEHHSMEEPWSFLNLCDSIGNRIM